jgi:hypothetical protein
MLEDSWGEGVEVGQCGNLDESYLSPDGVSPTSGLVFLGSLAQYYLSIAN